MTKTDTDASKWEYTTYAPKGERCPACMKPIKSLAPVRRGLLGRREGPPVIVYRHTDCAQSEEAA
ncbi:hypothetical protein [Streptomyces sp. NPDC006879]|uniref:hypothetical protein n=1 Tax=Streptomyces sp. NPDC006879 TaxID=3364767 RepID=UPI0036A7880A